MIEEKPTREASDASSAAPAPSSTHAFTIGPAALADEIGVLARSVAEHLSIDRFHWFVLDDWDEDLTSRLGSAAEVVPLPPEPAHGIGPENPVPFAPGVALELARRPDCSAVLFLAPRVAVFSPIPELDPLDGVALTPTVLRLAMDGEEPHGELGALRDGAYATCLIAAAADEVGLQFLRWWANRVRLPQSGSLRSARAWLNLAPALFPAVRVLRSSRCGVSRDNLHERSLSGDANEVGIAVDGQPLGFFDFTGHDDGSLVEAAGRGHADRRSIESLLEWYLAARTSVRDGRSRVSNGRE